jgi:hypothetical protein
VNPELHSHIAAAYTIFCAIRLLHLNQESVKSSQYNAAYSTPP